MPKQVVAGDLSRITEKDLQQVVVDLATTIGYLTYHTYDSRRSNPGFPDLVLVGRGRVLFVELKAEKGVMTDDQAKWYAALVANGAEIYVWRPQDWKSGEISARLQHATP